MVAERKSRKTVLRELALVLAEIREEAKQKGLDKMTMREINAAIAAYRREKDPLYGRRKRISLTLSERMYREAKAAAESIGWDLGMVVRQAVGDYLEQLKHPKAGKNVLFDGQERQRIVKAISASTEQFKTGRYK